MIDGEHGNYDICEPCIINCHKDHDVFLFEEGTTSCFCNCGEEGSRGKRSCKLLKGRYFSCFSILFRGLGASGLMGPNGPFEFCLNRTIKCCSFETGSLNLLTFRRPFCLSLFLYLIWILLATFHRFYQSHQPRWSIFMEQNMKFGLVLRLKKP